MIDESTYGFSKGDAEELLASIGGMGDVEFEELKPTGSAGQFEIEFQVIDNVTLQYRVNGGSWVSILTLRQRANAFTLQHSIDPSTSFSYVTYHTGDDCTA